MAATRRPPSPRPSTWTACPASPWRAFATDGGDGPTDAAGALVDGTTLARARALGLDARAFLERNDSYAFFHALGDHLLTGPTGTNVADLYCVFAWPAPLETS